MRATLPWQRRIAATTRHTAAEQTEKSLKRVACTSRRASSAR